MANKTIAQVFSAAPATKPLPLTALIPLDLAGSPGGTFAAMWGDMIDDVATAAINAQTGTSYAIVASNRRHHITFSNAASIAATLAQAGTTGFQDGWFSYVENVGVGAVTITPSTSTINGAATLVLTSGMAATIFSDGINYRAIVVERAGIAVNLQTGTSYTYLSGDRGRLVAHSNGSAIAGTLPQATGSFGSGWFMWVQNRGAGTLTITPTTSTIDGAASLTLATDQGVLIASDGTNYFTARGRSSGGSGLTNFTEAVNTSAPNATTPAVSLTGTNGATNVDVVLLPKGTGATLAQIPDNTTTGGNKRGTYAVDWQRVRSNVAMVASGSGSFIAGGQNNTAAGAYGFASGDTNSAVSSASTAMGNSNTASGTSSSAFGSLGTASGNFSMTLGYSNTASAADSIAIGNGNQANGVNSLALGYEGKTRGITGALSKASGKFAVVGDAQARELVLRFSTTDATQTTITTTGLNANTANQLVLENASAFVVRGMVVGRQNSTGDTASWEFVAHIRRGANAAATAMVTACTPTLVAADAGAVTWALAVDADTTNGCLRVRVTGEAAKTIRWVAQVNSVEVVG